jgi:CO/xanthine dehydrogenase FAD-binding subunit
LAEDPNLLPVAGGTDLMVVRPAKDQGVIDLTRIPELRGIEPDKKEWRIGATTTFSEIGRSRRLRSTFPALAEAASVIGGWQIQNRATLGGNIANASPAGDSLPVLLALDAVVIAAGPEGERKVPYSEFHVGYRKTALDPGEIIAWIELPHPPKRSIQLFRKVGTREAQAISKVVVAMAARRVRNTLEDVRFGAGSVAATPVRLHEAEKVCSGRKANEALAEDAANAAMSEVQPIDDVRSTADYRRFVLGRIVRRMVLKAVEA